MKPLDETELYRFCPHCNNELFSETIDIEQVKKCSKCGFIFWNKPKPVVSFLLHKDGRVLMLQRAREPLKDYWVLPGGFISYKETPEQALQREIKEEVGFVPEIKKIIGVYQIDNDPRGIHLDIIYEGELKGEIQLSQEHQKFEFFSPDALPERIAYKHREAIEDWYKKGSQYA